MKMDYVQRERAVVLADEVAGLLKRYPNDAPPAILASIRAKMDELEKLTGGRHMDEIRAEHEGIRSYLHDPVNRPPQPGGEGRGSGSGGKDIGSAFVESKSFRLFDKGNKQSPTCDLELKTLLNTTGWQPESQRLPRIEPGASPPLGVLDLFNPGTTSYNSVNFMRETTTTSGAAEVAEGELKAESTLAFTEIDSPVRTIATLLPITVQLLEDVSACRDYVNGRLGYFVRQRLAQQLLAGDGAAPNLRGILNVVGVQTQAKGADPAFDAIHKGIVKVQVNSGYDPTGIAMHPNDYQDIRLTRTADGIYIMGNPADVGTPRLWGLPVVQTLACTEGTAIVGAFKTAAQPFFRSDLQIAISDSHADYFIYNKLMIRAELRVALCCFQPLAFCLVSGI